MLGFYDCVAICAVAYIGLIVVLCISDVVEDVWKNKK